MSDRQRVTPPQTTMWPSPPRLSLSISSVVSPAAMVVLAHSAIFRLREKTTLRPVFRMSANGWSVAVVIDLEMASYAVWPMMCAYALWRKSSAAGLSG
jgi:hypothetical protein